MIRFLKSPALHFALIGLVIFAATKDRVRPEPAATVEIPWTRAQLLYDEIAQSKGRPITPEEQAEADQMLIDRETLYQYSRQIGMHQDPVVQRRLAQIVSFVAENPHEAPASIDDGADRAMALGIMDGDPVSRRIMIDSAQRLIRATALILQPSDEDLEQYVRDHAEEFQRPSRTRITHVTLNTMARGKRARADAEKVLARLLDGDVPPTEAAAFGDESIVPSELGLIDDRALERRFGRDFVVALAEVPVGSWQGPIRSRLGEHLVFVHERLPSRNATLDEVREQASSRMRNEAADRALRDRLDELQLRFDVRVQEPPS